MQKYICIVLALICIFSVKVAGAKVYWLPDFLGEKLDGVNIFDENRGDKQQCPSGWLSAPEAAGLKCANKERFPGAGLCYSDCVDPCEGLTDFSCESYGCAKNYAECPSKCEECYSDNCHIREDNTINEEWGCQKYWDDCGSKCEIPNKDNCSNREDNIINEEWGCQKYWDDCDTKCEIPNENNCPNREDNETDLGCQKYWSDCPSKCEIGITCIPTDCSAYPLLSPPANASYEECTSCDSDVVKYRLISCNPGYYDKESFICENKQLCTWSVK